MFCINKKLLELPHKEDLLEIRNQYTESYLDDVKFIEYDDGSWEGFRRYDDGQIDLYVNSKGEWFGQTFNEYGLITSYIDSSDRFEKFSYDKNNNLINYENSYGEFERIEYNKHNVLIYYINSNGYVYKTPKILLFINNIVDTILDKIK